MKFLQWIKDNVNLVSFAIGLGFIAYGKSDIGQTIITQGAQL